MGGQYSIASGSSIASNVLQVIKNALAPVAQSLEWQLMRAPPPVETVSMKFRGHHLIASKPTYMPDYMGGAEGCIIIPLEWNVHVVPEEWRWEVAIWTGSK